MGDRITQIGESVHRSAMEGGDAVPDKSRSVLKNHPASFTPDYSKSTSKSAGDVAEAEGKAKRAAINAKEAEDAAKKAKDEAEMKANAEKDTKEKIAKLEAKAGELKTVVEKEANEAKIKELKAKVETTEDEKAKA